MPLPGIESIILFDDKFNTFGSWKQQILAWFNEAYDNQSDPTVRDMLLGMQSKVTAGTLVND